MKMREPQELEKILGGKILEKKREKKGENVNANLKNVKKRKDVVKQQNRFFDSLFKTIKNLFIVLNNENNC